MPTFAYTVRSIGLAVKQLPLTAIGLHLYTGGHSVPVIPNQQPAPALPGSKGSYGCVL